MKTRVLALTALVGSLASGACASTQAATAEADRARERAAFAARICPSNTSKVSYLDDSIPPFVSLSLPVGSNGIFTATTDGLSAPFSFTFQAHDETLRSVGLYLHNTAASGDSLIDRKTIDPYMEICRAHRIFLAERYGVKPLPPGQYRLTLEAVDANAKLSRKIQEFSVVK